MECKTSRADFVADWRKPFRVDPALGMGKRRFFMCAAGLIQPEEVRTWGLLWVRGASMGRVEIIKPSEDHAQNGDAQCFMLRSAWLAKAGFSNPEEMEYAI